MLGPPGHQRYQLRKERWRSLAARAGDHSVLLAFLYCLEAAHTYPRLATLAENDPKLLWALLATVAALVATIALLIARRKPLSEIPELDPQHRRVIEQVDAAMKQQPRGAVEAMKKVGECGLEIARDDWVHCIVEKDHAHPPGISESGSSWSCRVGPEGCQLIFTTGGRFAQQDILLMEAIGARLHLMLIYEAGLNTGFSGKIS